MADSRFSASTDVADGLLKSSVGLVTYDGFKKLRQEALDASNESAPPSSGASTPAGRDPPTTAVLKKRKKAPATKKTGGGLSFGADDDEADSAAPILSGEKPKKRLKPNTTLTTPAPIAQTKSALLLESQLKDKLRKEYLSTLEAVRQTDFMLPFVFFDGKSSPGGSCRMKKGDPVWLFLERARKVGAEGGDKRMRDWARIGVDDLMLVKGEVVVPHHYDFHFFMLNRSRAHHGPLFPYSADPTPATPTELLSSSTPDISVSTLSTAATRAAAPKQEQISDLELEGHDHDPAATKVVDRRWYERNKHIYPASVWEEFDPERDYSRGGRRDGSGNAFFRPR